MKKRLVSFFTKHPITCFWVLSVLLVIIMLPPLYVVFNAFPNIGEDLRAANDGKDINTNILYSIPIA